jgi:hypothetical protein
MNKSDIDYYEDDIIIDDLKGMLSTEADYYRTMEQLNLTEDEELIFKRARLHLKKGNPQMAVLRRAYQIFILKTFHNRNINDYDDQAILSQQPPKEDPIKQLAELANKHIGKLIVLFLLLFVIYRSTT